jgi:hypothetical protein
VVTRGGLDESARRGEPGCGTAGAVLTAAADAPLAAALAGAEIRAGRAWAVAPDGAIGGVVALDAPCAGVPPVVLAEEGAPPGDGEIVVFVRFFSAALAAPFQFIDSFVVSAGGPVWLLFARVAAALGVPETTPFWAYAEGSDCSARQLGPLDSFAEAGIGNGGTIIVQCNPGFCAGQCNAKAKFGEPLAPSRPPPEFPQARLDEEGEVIVVDVTAGDAEFEARIATVDEWLDFRYHLVYVGIVMLGSSDPPQVYFRVPAGIALVHLDDIVSANAGISPPLKYFVREGAGPALAPIDRVKNYSLRGPVTAVDGWDQHPVILYVAEEDG